MLLSGYLGLWLLLFRDRVTARAVLAGAAPYLVALAGAGGHRRRGSLNYRLNYYDEVPRPTGGPSLHALVARWSAPWCRPASASTTRAPHGSPRSAWSSAAWPWRRRRLAAADPPPGLARAAVRGGRLGAADAGADRSTGSIFGVAVVDNVIYFFLPTALFVIGCWRPPRPAPPPGRGAVGSDLGRASGSVRGADAGARRRRGLRRTPPGPTQRYQLPGGGQPRLRRAGPGLRRGAGGPGAFSVVNSDVPGHVVPEMFAPVQPGRRVLGLTVPEHSASTSRSAPYYRLGRPATWCRSTIDWVAEGSRPNHRGAAARLLNATRTIFGRRRDVLPDDRRHPAVLDAGRTRSQAPTWCSAPSPTRGGRRRPGPLSPPSRDEPYRPGQRRRARAGGRGARALWTPWAPTSSRRLKYSASMRACAFACRRWQSGTSRPQGKPRGVSSRSRRKRCPGGKLPRTVVVEHERSSPVPTPASPQERWSEGLERKRFR